jgi:methionyl aminopeptidase
MSHIQQPNPLTIKSPEEVEAMARAGAALGRVLRELGGLVATGASGAEVDQLARALMEGEGASPTFLGYEGYPASICFSVDDVVVHGIPSKEPVSEGSLVSVDAGLTLDGWVADAACTWCVGEPSRGDALLLRQTRLALEEGIVAAQVGSRIGDISRTVQRVLQGAGLGVVRDVVGHGIGRHLHEEPSVPNHGRPGKGPVLVEGMVLAIEPMATLGSGGIVIDPDDWTARSRDGSQAAHFEHTVAITSSGPRVLTPWHLPA